MKPDLDRMGHKSECAWASSWKKVKDEVTGDCSFSDVPLAETSVQALPLSNVGCYTLVSLLVFLVLPLDKALQRNHLLLIPCWSSELLYGHFPKSLSTPDLLAFLSSFILRTEFPFPFYSRCLWHEPWSCPVQGQVLDFDEPGGDSLILCWWHLCSLPLLPMHHVGFWFSCPFALSKSPPALAPLQTTICPIWVLSGNVESQNGLVGKDVKNHLIPFLCHGSSHPTTLPSPRSASLGRSRLQFQAMTSNFYLFWGNPFTCHLTLRVRRWGINTIYSIMEQNSFL